MLYRGTTAVCSEIHTQHINTLCVQNVEFFNVQAELKKCNNEWGQSLKVELQW
jgi:hypothetical protein